MHHSWLSTIIIDCDDLDAGVAFWTSALGATAGEREEPYVFLSGVSGGLSLGLQRVAEPKTAKSRVHLDITSDDVEAEVARLEALGARRQARVEKWWVMEDPCGNEFCVVPGARADVPAGARTWQS